jgi:hypothetical protein
VQDVFISHSRVLFSNLGDVMSHFQQPATRGAAGVDIYRNAHLRSYSIDHQNTAQRAMD